ncbi:hypothetical protein AGRHK599_LOCUS4985 [Rhizobium rhizogenes]|uniref:Uncharacterized protein n=1 Tax=Rhizobium rhizogenes TaxID=359 RepID=A0AAN2DG18_RHIRH|nr:hypothetical protein AGRHK599_LOCUS4985 [Rhizobium rhizogenes]
MGMLHQHVGQRLQLRMRIGRTRRVGRRVEDEPLGLRRDRLFEIRRLKLEVMLLGGRNENRRAAAKRHHLGIRHPVRRRDDDFIARVQRRHEGVEQDLLAAGANDRLLPGIFQTVFALELGGDRLAQLGDTGHRRVLRFAAVDRVDGGRLDIVGRIEIRLSYIEADHVPALSFKLAKLLRDNDSGRRLYTGESIGTHEHDRLTQTFQKEVFPMFLC